MKLIGIGGGTCSGKSTLARLLLQRFGADCSLVPMDNYYLASRGSLEERAALNHDLPSAFDWPLLRAHIRALGGGEAVEMPLYDFVLHNRTSRTQMVEPREVVVLEGLFALYDREIRNAMSLRIFLDSTTEQRRRRRLHRDLEERGGESAYTERKFDSMVEPAYCLHVEPTRRWADLVSDNLDTAEAAVVDRLTGLL